MANPVIDFAFDDKAKAAQKAAEKIAAAMVVEISKETEAAIKAAITMAIREGIPPYEAARLVKSLIGLTAAQGQAVIKYRKELIDGGLALAKVTEKVDAYAEDLLVSRSETIARSEIMDALNSGVDEAWQQAQSEGLLSEGATKELILSEDACEVCVEASKAGDAPVGEELPGGDPPIHPRCRCTIGIAKP